MAPSKTFNLAGLQCAFAVIQNPELRALFQEMRSGLVPHVNAMGMVAAVAAYREGQSWLGEILEYLVGNREVVASYVRDRLAGVSMVPPEGTHLAWLNCRESAARDRPYEYFLQKARVALSDGSMFGPGGEGFVRLNFACHRSTLIDALDRMARSLTAGDP
jgi:cystathionine beta-lyase